MKTFNEWWGSFCKNYIIGIDQDEVEKDYRTLSDEEINHLLSSNVGYSEYIDCLFREFCI